MDALSHIYALSGSLSLNPLPLLRLPFPHLVSKSLPAHSDTCQEEDMTVLFLKGPLCILLISCWFYWLSEVYL